MLAVQLSEPWAVLVAALGASLLTVGGTMGIEWRRSKHAAESARDEERLQAYSEVLARSGLLALTADTLRLTMYVRSGLAEAVNVGLRLREPIEPIDIDVQVRRDLEPFWMAMARISVIGTPRAISAAQELADSVASVLQTATSRGELGSRTGRALRGDRWTSEQADQLDCRRRELASSRQAFADVARQELGAERFVWTNLQQAPAGDSRQQPTS